MAESLRISTTICQQQEHFSGEYFECTSQFLVLCICSGYILLTLKMI
jgi:hypothetical protein